MSQKALGLRYLDFQMGIKFNSIMGKDLQKIPVVHVLRCIYFKVTVCEAENLTARAGPE